MGHYVTKLKTNNMKCFGNQKSPDLCGGCSIFRTCQSRTHGAAQRNSEIAELYARLKKHLLTYEPPTTDGVYRGVNSDYMIKWLNRNNNINLLDHEAQKIARLFATDNDFVVFNRALYPTSKAPKV